MGRAAPVLAALASLALAASAVTPVSAQPAALSYQAHITIHADRPGAVINPDVYGQFAEFLGQGIYGGLWVGENSPIPNTRGWRNDVVGALRTLGVPLVRWPGGCFADRYHWRDGIGPRAQRPVRLNETWGGVEESNGVGLHEYMDLLDQLGAKAYINANVGTASPQEAADLLEYMTSSSNSALANERRRNGRAEPWSVAYFALGNELWQCGGNMKPEEYAAVYRHYATFAWTPDGYHPKLIAAGAYDTDYAWTQGLMANIRGVPFDGITLHHFSLPTHSWTGPKGPATGFGEDQWFSIMQSASAMEDYINRHERIMDRYDPQKHVGLFIDEWSNWYDPEPGFPSSSLHQQNTLRDAVTAAVNLNIFHAHADRVRMACITQMVNVLQAMIHTDGPRMFLTPTYHVYMMYRPFRGATDLPVTLAAPLYRFGHASAPSLSVSAARDSAGVLHLAIANLDPNRAAHIETQVVGANVSSVSGSIITADAMDAHNTFDAPNALVPAVFTGASIHDGRLSIDAPAKSVIVLDLR